MQLRPIDLLKTWHIDKRVCVPDEAGTEAPLFATVVAIDADFSGFTVKWDHNCGTGWQPVEDLHYFEAA